MYKILIVEDEEAYVSILTAELSYTYEVISATTGKAGLRAAITEQPDLVLLDIGLPLMDGLSLLKQLRQHPRGRYMKVIVLTNFEATNKIVRQVTCDLPAYYFVKSDTSMQALLAKIDDTLSTPVRQKVGEIA